MENNLRRANIGGLVYALRIAVAGNPNCGKTTIFNRLTIGGVADD